MDLVRVREYCCSVVSVYLEKQLEAGRPSRGSEYLQGYRQSRQITSPEIPVIVKTFNMGGISDFGHGWWLPMFEPN